MTPTPSNGTNIEELLEHVDYGINVVDSDFNVLHMNKASLTKFNISASDSYPFKCHEILFNNPEPCANCPVKQMEESGERFGQLVGALNTPNNPNHRVKYHKLDQARYVQTLADVTRETELVRQVSLQSKETQAQNLILKRKRQELEEHTAFLDSIFNSIQSGIMVLDSAMNLTITSANKAISTFLPAGKELVKNKCFQVFGFQRRCPGCPIENVNKHAKWHSLRYHQKVSDHTLTEYYSQLPDGKILLIFEDSTKRVNLLQQLKEHKEIIERQNLIFRSLLETSTLIQQTSELDELFNCTLSQLGSLFITLSFGLILDGERPELMESAVFRGITEDEQQAIIKHNIRLLDDDVSLVLNQYFKDHGLLSNPGMSESFPNWWVLPMRGRERRVLGKLLIKGDAIDQQSTEIISLFLEQVTAVAENKLLTRQLEKMANTDALTGAYNRGYFDRELERSIETATRFPNVFFTVLLIDVNGLKRVNDVFGHQDGDAMIIKVAQLLTSVCRKTDIVTRLGGDEFAMLCPSSNYKSTDVLLNRIREHEAQTELLCKHANGEEEIVPIRMSIGMASSEDTHPEEVLKLADKRMYEDKEAFYATRDRYR